MKKGLILSVIIAMSCCFCALLPKHSAKASSNAVLSESQIDALFVEHAVNLGHWDTVNNCFVYGTATDYICKKNNAGVVIQPGFKKIEENDNISGKTIYIFNPDGQIGDFTNGVSSANGEYQVFTSVGDYAVFAMGTAPIVQSELLTGSTFYHKIKAPKEVSLIKSVEPFVSEGCSLFYTYEKIPEISSENESINLGLESSENSSWLAQNWMPLLITTGVVTLLVAFLIIIKKC
ncbi:MAG: hypothetical protein IKA99_07915 [Clostridia bacterium]|nr:hypothetical protein [Clostridia bacterium]